MEAGGRVRSLGFLVLLTGLLLLVNPLLSWIGLRSSLLDLPLVATCFLAQAFPTRQGFWTALAGGLVADLLIPGTLPGMYMEVMGLIFLLIRGLSERLPLDRPLPMILVTLVAGILKTLLFYLLSLIFDGGFQARATALLWAIPTVVVTGLTAPLLILPFVGLDILTGGQRRTDHRIL